LGCSLNQIDCSCREASFLKQFRQTLADSWCVLRWFEDDGISFQHTRAQHPERHGEREVPLRNDRDDAPWLAAYEGVLLGNLRRKHVAHRHSASAEDVL